MTLTERLAALPPIDPYAVDCAASFHEAAEVVGLKDYNALLARNALLCESLREQMEITTCGECDCAFCAEHRAVLAACEVKP